MDDAVKLNFCCVCGCRIEKDEANASFRQEADEVGPGETREWQHYQCPKIVWIPVMQAETLAMLPQPFEKLEDAKADCDSRLRGILITARSDWEPYGSKAGMSFTTKWMRQLFDPLYPGETWQSVEAFRLK